MNAPHKLFLPIITKRLPDRSWRSLLLLILPISLLLFLSVTTAGASNGFNAFYYLNNLKSFFYNSNNNNNNNPPSPGPPCRTTDPRAFVRRANVTEKQRWANERKAELDRSRIAVCLVGGARRFELTGPSIVEKVLDEYPNSDLFLNSPLDSNSYKFSLLKSAPRIAAVRIFRPNQIAETESDLRVLTASNSPNGIQGLLQYFNLVEGCLTMIQSYQQQNNFTYDWIVRTRVDGYWSDPLNPELFTPGHYVAPIGSSYGGLNDRFGVGDLNTSVAALSRRSMVPELDSAGFRELNSESAFRAQLTVRNVTCVSKKLPFCVVSDRTYPFPPGRAGVPVAAMSSEGPLSGAKCRPCRSVCSGQCAAIVVNRLDRRWSWMDGGGGNTTVRLCDASGGWDDGWEARFDAVAGENLAKERKRVSELSVKQCSDDFEEMRRRAAVWDSPPGVEVCRLGLNLTYTKSHKD